MSIKAILSALLVLGTSSVALAHPVNAWNAGPTVRDHRGYGYVAPTQARAWSRHRQVRVRPVIAVPPPAPEIVTPGWYAPGYYDAGYQGSGYQGYTTGYPNNDADDGYAYANQWRQPRGVEVLGASAMVAPINLDLHGKLAGVSTLRFSASGGGGVELSRLVIYYAAGGLQNIDVKRYLDGRGGVYELPIGDGSQVTALIVEGRSDAGGAISIVGL